MKKVIVYAVIILLGFAGYSLFTWIRFHDDKLHVIFCDVGQGDGILIKTPEGKYITLDGGTSGAFADCLSKHMPFWQRTLTLSLVSHPHADHFMGLLPVLDHYKLDHFATEELKNDSFGYKRLLELIAGHKVPTELVFQSDAYNFPSGMKLAILGPDKAFLSRTSPNGLIGEGKEFASLVTLLTYGNLRILFTGDVQAGQLQENISGFGHINILQVPHHGSATGMNEAILSQLRPSIAVISVGKNNRYGHPSWQALELLKNARLPIKRTDQVGDIEIVSDGKGWKVL